ncbi:ABC transporter substrate-binding protein [Pendulispora albinea]|uniref:Helical backbone metal receptor n=1 Tax=Pendulispora albinea TaxID=2741071 RepID=A0ABZ2LY42_9BACT
MPRFVPPGSRRPALTVALAVSLVLIALSCHCSRKHQDSPPAAKIDAAARVAKRVVSLSPSTTEALFAIGAKDVVVGRSRYCDFPPEALALPQVGGYADPNFEAVLALKPDLVVGGRGPAGVQLLDRLVAFGTEGYFPETESFAQIDAMLLGMGNRTGHTKEAEALIARMHAREAEVRAAVAGRPRPRVLIVFGLEPIVVGGPKSFSNEMIDHAEGDNAVRDGAVYPTLGMEQILALDPDVVVNAAVAGSHGHQRITRDAPGWSELRAVKGGRVVPIVDDSVLRPGPRVIEGVAVLARALHPDAAIH